MFYGPTSSRRVSSPPSNAAATDDDRRAARGGRVRLIGTALRPHVGPALLLQLHNPHHARLHERGLRNKWNFLVLRFAHVFLGVATSHERNERRILHDRLDAVLHRRGVVAQHIRPGPKATTSISTFSPR